MITTPLILNLLLILSAAWVLGSLFSRFGLPAMLGELLAGVILGPPLLGVVLSSDALELLAELGIFFVMFHSGMEMDPKELLEHIWPSLGVALGGFLIPYTLGFLTAKAFGATLFQALVIGMGVSVTAIAVQMVILYSMRINRSELGHIIIGAAIADDIFALIALSTILGLAETGSISFLAIGLILLKVIAFFALYHSAG
jgi:Kef-type K+ transport system membrane component KefB